jgi:ATP-dependent Lon protease
MKRVIAPVGNKPDWHEIPATVRRDLEFTCVETMDQVIAAALGAEEAHQPAIPMAANGGAASHAEDDDHA